MYPNLPKSLDPWIPYFVSASSREIPSGNELVVPGMSYNTQWVNPLPGASGSKQIRANARVPFGALYHVNGGDRSSPSLI